MEGEHLVSRAGLGAWGKKSLSRSRRWLWCWTSASSRNNAAYPEGISIGNRDQVEREESEKSKT